MARKGTDTVNLRLRMPEALRKTLASEAEKANRSLNSEILWRLGQTFGEQWQRFIAGMEEQERTEQERLDRMMQDPKLQKALREIIAKHWPDKKGQ
jgi:translation initiation factor 2 alpha subunit (eIF-2alpha)